MENQNKLYNKRSRSLEYFLLQSKNPSMLLRWCRHFILNIASSEAFLENDIQNHADYLFPDFRVKIFQILEKYNEININHQPGFFETFRSNKRQYEMYQKGTSKIKSYGMHFYGIAVDIISFKNNRPSWSLDYDTLIRLGNQINITNLRPFEDCHFQFIPVSSQNDFREFARNLTYIVQDLLNVKQDYYIGPITQGQILINHSRLAEYFNDIEKLIQKSYGTN